MSWRGYLWLLGILAVGTMSSRARAQPGPPADEAFARGREMLKIGNYAAACAAFEDSQRLAPQLETQFNIALCSEQLGKLATALALHRVLADNGPNSQRRAMSADLVTQLEARVPRLRIAITASGGTVPEDVTVRVNGVPVTVLEHHPIDLGTSSIVATAPGFESWSGQVIAAAEGSTVTVTIPLAREGASAGPGDPTLAQDGLRPRRDAEARPRSGRTRLATVALVGGGIGLAAGVTFGVLARGTWTEAQDVCGGGTTCATAAQLARANALAEDARLRGNVSTISLIAGGALVVGGVVLWVTAPSGQRAIAIAPAVAPSSATVTVVGRF